MERKNFPLLFALVWLLLKSGLKFSDYYEYSYEIGIGLNLLILPFVVIFAIRPLFHEKGIRGTAVAKKGMRAGAVYVLCVAAGIFIYYQFIDPDFASIKADRVLNGFETQIAEAGGWEKLKESRPELFEDPILMDMSKEEFLESRRTVYESTTAFIITTQSLMALMILMIFYSGLMALLFKLLNRT